MNLDGKVALITGSSRGIGNSIARLFIKEGAKVVVCGSKLENAVKAVEQIKKDLKVTDDVLLPVGLNMKDREHVQKIVETIIDKWGKIDILVNH